MVVMHALFEAHSDHINEEIQTLGKRITKHEKRENTFNLRLAFDNLKGYEGAKPGQPDEQASKAP